jgi:hypothetical protein
VYICITAFTNTHSIIMVLLLTLLKRSSSHNLEDDISKESSDIRSHSDNFFNLPSWIITVRPFPHTFTCIHVSISRLSKYLVFLILTSGHLIHRTWTPGTLALELPEEDLLCYNMRYERPETKEPHVTHICYFLLIMMCSSVWAWCCVILVQFNTTDTKGCY